jgi:hypothetical protein
VKKEEVLSQIATISDVTPKVVDSANPRVTFIGDGAQLALKPSTGARSIPLSVEGSKNLIALVGMTNKMRTDLSGGTFQKAASELLAKHGRFTVLTKDGIGVDVLGGKHHYPVEPERALRSIESAGMNFHRVYTKHDRSVVIQTLGDRIEQVTRTKGDRVQAGAAVIFSPIGTVIPAVQSFSMVIACTNGLTMEEVSESFKFSDGGGSSNPNGFWDWFRKNLRKAMDSIGIQTQHFRELQAHRIAPNDRPGALEGVLQQAHLPDDLEDLVRARALAHPPENAWEMLNLITYATSHATTDYDIVRRSNKAMSTFAHNVAVHKVCPLCHEHSNN